jgi:hypothetical protein
LAAAPPVQRWRRVLAFGGVGMLYTWSQGLANFDGTYSYLCAEDHLWNSFAWVCGWVMRYYSLEGTEVVAVVCREVRR